MYWEYQKGKREIKRQKKYLKQLEFSQTNVKHQTTELGSSENTIRISAKTNPSGNLKGHGCFLY